MSEPTTTRTKTGGRMSPHKFEQKEGSLLQILQLPENKELRKKYNRNLRKARQEAEGMEQWAANDFMSGPMHSDTDPDDRRHYGTIGTA